MRIRGIDWGLSHPTVCLWAYVDVPKMVYFYDEHYRSGLSIQEHCDIIKNKTGNHEIDWTVIDPSMFKRDKFNVNRKEADEFARYGIYCVAGNNQSIGYDISKMFFKKGMIKISPKCKNLIQEIKSVKWGDKVNEDCTDVLRYMLTRIHETIHNMNVFESEIKEVPKNNNIISLNDKRLFPEDKENDNLIDGFNWGLEEAI